MKKIIFLTLALIILFSSNAFSKIIASKQPFTDISPNHWAYQAIVDLYNRGIIKGFYNEPVFRGEKKLSRYDISVLLDRTIKYLENSQKLSTLNSDDLKKLKKLLIEFSNEIEKIELEQASLKNTIIKIDEKLNRLEKRQSLVEKSVKKLAKETRERNKKLRPLDIILIIATGVLIGKVY